METLFGAQFSEVRIHVGPEAPSIGARAFTLGSSLFFAPGQYHPEGPHGRRLLAHELTHVVQQRQGRVRHPFGASLAVVLDPGLEAEAERMSLRAVSASIQAKMPSLPAAYRLGRAMEPRVAQAMFQSSSTGLSATSYPTEIYDTQVAETVYQEGFYGEYYGMKLTHTFKTNNGGIMDSDIEISEKVTILRNDLGADTGESHPLGTEIWRDGISEIDDMIATPIKTWDVLKKKKPPLVCLEKQEFYYRRNGTGWNKICDVDIRVELTTDYKVVTTVNGRAVTQKCKHRQVSIPGLTLVDPIAQDFFGNYYVELNP